ncbi:hypothetical protein CHARACLAT_021748 [Characodon lateralis]|uniref:Uncharacterized protein n=1 Tax=Characodon lateralis TaxID=208331 RepID=A0ABU7EFV7_9TELE|nr:hypothetical protein [Characodon lateralis]
MNTAKGRRDPGPGAGPGPGSGMSEAPRAAHTHSQAVVPPPRCGIPLQPPDDEEQDEGCWMRAPSEYQPACEPSGRTGIKVEKHDQQRIHNITATPSAGEAGSWDSAAPCWRPVAQSYSALF